MNMETFVFGIFLLLSTMWVATMWAAVRLFQSYLEAKVTHAHLQHRVQQHAQMVAAHRSRPHPFSFTGPRSREEDPNLQ